MIKKKKDEQKCEKVGFILLCFAKAWWLISEVLIISEVLVLSSQPCVLLEKNTWGLNCLFVLRIDSSAFFRPNSKSWTYMIAKQW